MPQNSSWRGGTPATAWRCGTILEQIREAAAADSVTVDECSVHKWMLHTYFRCILHHHALCMLWAGLTLLSRLLLCAGRNNASSLQSACFGCCWLHSVILLLTVEPIAQDMQCTLLRAGDTCQHCCNNTLSLSRCCQHSVHIACSHITCRTCIAITLHSHHLPPAAATHSNSNSNRLLTGSRW